MCRYRFLKTMELLSTLLVSIITAIAGAGSGWFFARRKQTAEAVQSELVAVEKAVGIWRTIAQDLKTEMESQSREISKLREEISTLRKDNARLLSELKIIKKNQNEADKKL